MATVENGVVLLHCEDLTDSLDTATITNYGTTISNEQYKFGSNSLYFNKSSYITIDITSQDNYTIEFWAYPIGDNTAGWYPTLFSSNTGNGSGGTHMHVDDGAYSTYPVCRANLNSGVEHTGGYGVTIITRNEWHHIALCKSGSNHYFFVDGILQKNVTQSTPDIITTWYIGVLKQTSSVNSGTYFNGYIDELLISSVCKWTEAFTPPIEPYGIEDTGGEEDEGIYNIIVGTNEIKEIYLGTKNIIRAYFNNVIIFENLNSSLVYIYIVDENDNVLVDENDNFIIG